MAPSPLQNIAPRLADNGATLFDNSPSFVVLFEPINEPSPVGGHKFEASTQSEAHDFARNLVTNGRARPDNIVIYQRLAVRVTVLVESLTEAKAPEARQRFAGDGPAIGRL